MPLYFNEFRREIKTNLGWFVSNKIPLDAESGAQQHAVAPG
jgi:hypothetical protein